MQILAVGIRKLNFSTISFELGKKVPTRKLKNSLSKFFKLTKLNGIDEALRASEGSVVVSSLNRPSSYDSLEESFKKLMAKFYNLEQENLSFKVDIEKLNSRVATLELTPAFIGIVETIRTQEKLLIRHFFPLLFQEIHPSNQRLSYLKKKFSSSEKDPKNEMAHFFTNPVVMKLDEFISSLEWENIEKIRNTYAHYAIKDLEEIESTWDRIISKPVHEDEKRNKVSFNSDIGKEIANICELVAGIVGVKTESTGEEVV